MRKFFLIVGLVCGAAQLHAAPPTCWDIVRAFAEVEVPLLIGSTKSANAAKVHADHIAEREDSPRNRETEEIREAQAEAIRLAIDLEENPPARRGLGAWWRGDPLDPRIAELKKLREKAKWPERIQVLPGLTATADFVHGIPSRVVFNHRPRLNEDWVTKVYETYPLADLFYAHSGGKFRASLWPERPVQMYTALLHGYPGARAGLAQRPDVLGALSFVAAVDRFQGDLDPAIVLEVIHRCEKTRVRNGWPALEYAALDVLRGRSLSDSLQALIAYGYGRDTNSRFTTLVAQVLDRKIGDLDDAGDIHIKLSFADRADMREAGLDFARFVYRLLAELEHTSRHPNVGPVTTKLRRGLVELYPSLEN